MHAILSQTFAWLTEELRICLMLISIPYHHAQSSPAEYLALLLLELTNTSMNIQVKDSIIKEFLLLLISINININGFCFRRRCFFWMLDNINQLNCYSARKTRSQVQVQSFVICALPGASTRDPTHDKITRRKPYRQGGSGFQGFWKAAPGAHLKDDIGLSDACFNRLLPNFCDTCRRPSPISFQIRINLEL